MKSLLKFISLLAFIGCYTVYAQTTTKKVDIEWGPESITREKNSMLGKIIAKDESGFYFVRLKLINLKEYKVTLDYYDNSFNPVKSVQIENIQVPLESYQVVPDRYMYENVLEMGGNLYLFTTMLHKKDKMRELFVQKIDQSTLLPDEKMTSLAVIPSMNPFVQASFDLRFSSDRSKLLIFCQEKPVKESAAIIHFIVMDNQMNKLLNRDYQTTYMNEKYIFIDYRIDNNGNVFTIGEVLTKGIFKLMENGKANFFFDVNYFPVGSSEPNQILIDRPDYPMCKLMGAFDNDGNAVITGFYSATQADDIKGTFFIRLDVKTKEILKENYKEIPAELYVNKWEQYPSNQKQFSKINGFCGLDAKYLITRDNGDMLLMAECFYYFQSFTPYDYYLDDIFVFYISKDGSFKWEKRIPKRQGANYGVLDYTSFYTLAKDDKVYFLYNDTPDRWDKDEIRNNGGSITHSYIAPYLKNQAVLMLAAIDYDGNYSKELVWNWEESLVFAHIGKIYKISSGELLIPGYMMDKERYIKLKFR